MHKAIGMVWEGLCLALGLGALYALIEIAGLLSAPPPV